MNTVEQPDIARIGADLREYAAAHPLSVEDRYAFYPTFVKVAARILFVPILLGLASGRQERDADSDRRAALTAAIMSHREELEILL